MRGLKIANYPSSTNLNVQLGESNKSYGSERAANEEGSVKGESGKSNAKNFEIGGDGMFTNKKHKKTNLLMFILRCATLPCCKATSYELVSFNSSLCTSCSSQTANSSAAHPLPAFCHPLHVERPTQHLEG